MDEIQLNVEVRKEVGKKSARALRHGPCFPGIVYGGEKKATPIQVERRTFDRIRRAHHGGNIIFHLNLMEGDKKLKDYFAIIKEEQLHPVTDQILHIDFNRISLTEKIEVKVSVVAKGEPIGVKRDGGSLEHNIWQLDIVCLPTQIPPAIEVEVAHLEIGQVIQVKDIVLPEGVITKHDLEAIVLTVVPPMKEDIAPTTEMPTEPEVLKEKKEVEGEKKATAGEEGKEEKKEKKEEKKEEKKK
jgi:large subunit ribosomal protein L25